MRTDSAANILVIEDNPGDFALVEEFLHEKIASATITLAVNFETAKHILLQPGNAFDAILLDLSLPDKKAEPLIIEIVELCGDSPVIALTGYADFSFSVKSLSMGISDYILKEELTADSLYKSIIYSSERKKIAAALATSEKKYSDLFHLSPLPMWVVSTDTLCFLDVNMATVNNYGYTHEEFMSMTLKDIRPAEEVPLLMQVLAKNAEHPDLPSSSIAIHKKKNGELRNVEFQVAPIQFKGINANVVIATDITEQLIYIKAIEEQNKKLSEIAWMQSHVVRAPVARIMGLIQMMSDFGNDDPDKEKILEYIMSSANELDAVIREISNKADAVGY